MTAASRVQPIAVPTDNNGIGSSALAAEGAVVPVPSPYAAASFAAASTTGSIGPRLRHHERVFGDAAAVGAFLANEGALARMQARHRAFVDRERDRDSDDEEGALEDSFLRGLGSGSGTEGPSSSSKLSTGGVGRGGGGGGSGGLRLNRRIVGVLTDDFYGLLRATERELEAPAPRSQQTRGESDTTTATNGPSSNFKPGPLTRALYAKQSAIDDTAARRAAFRAKQRATTAVRGVPREEDDDETEATGLTRRTKRGPEGGDPSATDDAHAHHRLCLPDCVVPPTITYLKGQAIAWYFTSSVDSSIKRKHSRNLQADRIIDCMNATSYRTPWQSERPIEIVAVFYPSEAHLAPMFMSRTRMESFVRHDAHATRPSGVLQKFVPPVSEFNSMIRVTWTPAMCLVERRTSGYRLGATRIRLDDRVQTYEVSTGLGIEVKEEIVHESSSMRRVIAATCAAIADHFAIVHGHTVAGQQSRHTSSTTSSLHSQGRACRPVKMTLYFKLAGLNQLYLLLCDELKWSKIDLDEPADNTAAARRARSTIPEEAEETTTPNDAAPMMMAAPASGASSVVGSSRRRAPLLLPSAMHDRAQPPSAITFTGSTAYMTSAGGVDAHANVPRKKRGDLRCGHCAQYLTPFNSHIAGSAQLPSSSTAAPSHGKPYVDLKSIIMYRLSLCAYLLPAAAVTRLDSSRAISASEKLYSEFLWNLTRPVLTPDYMVDEKDFKIHLYFHSVHEREAAVAAAAAAAAAASSEPSLSSTLLNPPPTTTASSGYGERPKAAPVKSAPPLSIWETRIYVCKACSHSIRGWRRAHEASQAATMSTLNPTSNAGSTTHNSSALVSRSVSPTLSSRGLDPSTPFAPLREPRANTVEALDKLFNIMVSSYLRHNQLQPPTAVDLAVAPHSTGVPAVLSAVPAVPGAGMYVDAAGGGFLRSTNPYMVEQTTLGREQAAAVKAKVIEQQAARGDDDTRDATWAVPSSPAAYFARGATSLTPEATRSPKPKPNLWSGGGGPSPEDVHEDDVLDEWSVSAVERVRMALAQEAAQSGAAEAVNRLEAGSGATATLPSKEEREAARLQRLAARAARQARADQALLYEEWLLQQAQAKERESFAHVRSKLHEPLGATDAQRREREQRRLERAREAMLAQALLEERDRLLGPDADALSPIADATPGSPLVGASPTDARIIDDHETILKKLALLDPIRAEVLRARTHDATHKTPEGGPAPTPEEEQREIERLNGQLRSWYRRQVEREAAAFAQSPGFGPTIREDDEPPEFDASSPLEEAATTFGPPAAEVPNHHRRFPSYKDGRIFVSAGAAMDEREGLGFSGGREAYAAAMAAPRIRSADVRAASPSARAPHANSVTATVATTAAPSSQARARSATLRRTPLHAAPVRNSRTEVASASSTQTISTRATSASSQRPRTTATPGSRGGRPLSPASRREFERTPVAVRSFDNARAFLAGRSAYTRANEQTREMAGYAPAGFDPVTGESFSTNFGRNNSIGGPSDVHRPLRAASASRTRSAKKKTATTTTPHAARDGAKTNGSGAADDARKRLVFQHSASTSHLDARRREREEEYEEDSYGDDLDFDVAAPTPPTRAPPKSLAVFASAASVGLAKSESLPILPPRTQAALTMAMELESADEREAKLQARSRRDIRRGIDIGLGLARSAQATPTLAHAASGGQVTFSLSAAERADEADAYEIDDAPIFESDSEDANTQFDSRERDILSEEAIARAEAMLFQQAQEIVRSQGEQ